MIILTGNSLNERHRELNSKVIEAATNGVSFDSVKSQNEETDIDRLFKVDLANKYKNIDYIIETLKCGDGVYITRALKCAWLYQDELSHIINPEYLEQNIFPEMSFKMKRKFLKLISQHVSSGDRAALFCSYCIKNKLPNIALKFLCYASETYKADVIKEKHIFISEEDKINIIGNSFTLATVVLDEANEYNVCNLIKRLSYLYSVSDVKYLDLLEKYTLKHEIYFWPSNELLGLRISKNIIKSHKDRLPNRTALYVNMLNKKMLVKYSTKEDVKMYVTNLCSLSFWEFYSEYKFILDVFPDQERLQYLKEFMKSYDPSIEFEMEIEFYDAGLYKLMTKEERECWALEHIKAGREYFGHGQDFKWYQFVSFDKAFEPLKKYILIAANADVRNEIVNIMSRSAKSNRDLETLFSYYYQRFVNEMKTNKEKFVDDVLNMHDYYKFDKNCWQAFNKILHSMDVYDNKNAYSCKAEYKVTVIIYAIIHEIEVHEVLKQHIDDGLNLYTLKEHTNKMPAEKVEVVYNYLFNYYLKKINNFNIESYDDNVKFGVRKYIHSLLELMIKYEKPKEDIPEIVMKFVKLDYEEYQYNDFMKEEEKEEEVFRLTQFVLMKDLKKDASQVVSKIKLLKEELEQNRKFNLASLLRKLKIYFPTDITPKYVELYNNMLNSDELCEETYSTAVYGLFNLAKYADRIGLVSKYVPTDPKIDHVEIERKTLYVRTAICKHLCVSRPAVPLSETRKYIVGDYLKFCLPMFQSYAANLQPDALKEFVKYLLNSPASIQKHGIRLAFECFSIDNLRIIMSDIWNKTKNVSLRLVMYREVFKKIVKEQEEDLQKRLYETLKTFTKDVREEDDDELFTEMNQTGLPSHLLGDHILSTWNVLNTLPYKEIMITRMTNTLKNMADHYRLIQQEAVESIVSEHITKMIIERQMRYEGEYYVREFYNAKWILTAKYLMHLPSQDILEHKLRIVETIIKESLKLWHTEGVEQYSFRGFLFSFIEILVKNMCYTDINFCLNGIVLLSQILKDLQDALPLVEIYDTVWYLRLTVLAANVIVDGRRSSAEQGDSNNSLTYEQYIDNFAKEFACLFNEFIESNNCYLFAFETISGRLNTCCQNVKFNWPFKVETNNAYILSVICSRLVEIEKYETYKFALEILPECGGDLVTYYKARDRIQTFDNNDIRYYCYKKFEKVKNYFCIS